MKKLFIILALIGILIIGYATWQKYGVPKPIATVSYECDEGKTIKAVFYEGGRAEAQPGEMPTPTGKVELELSDGRRLNLKQTISASGVRYSDGNPMIEGGEHFVFWSKGEEALVLENNVEKSYLGCRQK